jgi:hypothetical protein
MSRNAASLRAVAEMQRPVGEREDRRAAEERRGYDRLTKPDCFDFIDERGRQRHG